MRGIGIPGKLWPMWKLLLALPVCALVGCGDNLEGNDPPDTPIPAVTPGCADATGDLQAFAAPDDFGPAVEGTLPWRLTRTPLDDCACAQAASERQARAAASGFMLVKAKLRSPAL